MILVLLANGLEEIEAFSSVDILRRAGLDVLTAAIGESRTVTGAHGIAVGADVLFSEVDASRVDGIVLPGGMPGALNLSECAGVRKMVCSLNAAGKLVAAICAAPFILGQLGVLDGKRATCYPGFEDKLTGATYTGEPVVQDGHVITGNGPASATDFALQIVCFLAGDARRAEVAKGMLHTPEYVF